MSCLYSSPEVTSVELLAVKLIALKLQALNCRHRCLVRSGMRLTRDLIAVQFDSTQILSTQILPYRRRQQRRAPHQLSGRRWLHQVIPPAKTSTVFYRGFSSAISGFRSLYGREQHSSSYCAQFDLLLEPFTRRALVSRTLASPASSYGASNPGPMLWPERSRSRGIFQGVFLRSKRTLSGHFVACDGPRNARQVGFGGCCRR